MTGEIGEEELVLTADEDALLSSVGYLVMRWNYAEHCARQILRQYLAGDALSDKDHLKLTRLPASAIEEELKKVALPKWQQPGREFLSQLITAYSSARSHRNRIVHGLYATSPSRGEWPPHLILISMIPDHWEYRPFIDLATIQRTAHHFHDLAMYAREVSLTFAGDGSFAYNFDGSRIMADLPKEVQALPHIELISDASQG